MKLYENVIKALFVSFRSERGRGVIRNAFAPRDGGHLLLAPLLSRSLIFSRSLSYSFFFSLFYPSFLFPLGVFHSLAIQSLLLSFLLTVNFSLSSSRSRAALR